MAARRLVPPADPAGPWPNPREGEIPYFLPPGKHGLQLSPNLFLLSWLGMTTGNIDAHIYALRSPDGLVLIDAGTPWGWARLHANAAHWELDLSRVRAVFLTHHHLDHARAGYLWQRQGAEILAHPYAAAAAGREWAVELESEGHAGVHCHADTLLTDGQRLRRCGFDIEVFHTPGHTPGCTSYRVTVDGQRWLFSGDVIMSNARPGYRGEFCRDTLVRMLQRLARLKFAHLGHGHDVLLNDHGHLFRGGLIQSARNTAW